MKTESCAKAGFSKIPLLVVIDLCSRHLCYYNGKCHAQPCRLVWPCLSSWAQSSIFISFYRAWNSKSEQIYRKPFDSRNAFDSAVQIMYHNCKITNGSILSVYRNLKTNTIHFVINGKEQKVSISGKGPDFCYGFLRLSAKGGGSEVRVTLFPVINEGTLL